MSTKLRYPFAIQVKFLPGALIFGKPPKNINTWLTYRYAPNELEALQTVMELSKAPNREWRYIPTPDYQPPVVWEEA